VRPRRWFRKAKHDKVKVITFPVYFNYKVTAVFTHSMEEAIKRLKLNVSMTPDTSAMHVRGEFESFILMPYDKSDTGTIVHESYHAIRYMFEQHDLEMTNEAVAYHLAYLVSEIVELALK
jgi:hypothetical protein